MREAEVIVVGAGPAGCAAAYDLAAAGVDVLLLDRKTFPRFKPCAGGLTIKTLRRLRYSVAPVVRHLAAEFVAGGVGGREWRVQGGPICALVVRQEFDAFCLERTLERGARFQQISGIDQIDSDAVGLTLSCGGEQYRTRYLLGADGAHSQVRRLSGLFKPEANAVALEGCVPRSALAAMPDFTFDFHVVDQGYGWLFPKGDHVNVGLYTQRSHRVPLSKQALLDYAERRLGTRQVDDIVGFPIATTGEWQAPAKARVLLAGDAAGFAEPLLGEGLHNAVYSGQLAAEAILAAKAGADLQASYEELTLPLRRDLFNSRVAANLFYDFPKASFWLMEKYFGARMMAGMAEGRTLTESVLPWRWRLPTAPNLSLQELLSAGGTAWAGDTP